MDIFPASSEPISCDYFQNNIHMTDRLEKPRKKGKRESFPTSMSHLLFK